jgi:hypothetical protein
MENVKYLVSKYKIMKDQTVRVGILEYTDLEDEFHMILIQLKTIRVTIPDFTTTQDINFDFSGKQKE